MKYLIGISLSLLSCFSFAEAMETPQAVPTNLHVYSAAGNTFVDMPPTGCSGGRYFLDSGHIKYDSIISILLAAQVSNRPVVIRFEGCVNGNNPQGNIVGVYLK